MEIKVQPWSVDLSAFLAPRLLGQFMSWRDNILGKRSAFGRTASAAMGCVAVCGLLCGSIDFIKSIPQNSRTCWDHFSQVGMEHTFHSDDGTLKEILLMFTPTSLKRFYNPLSGQAVDSSKEHPMGEPPGLSV